MNLLAIDTSTDRAVLALACEGAPVVVGTTDGARRHGSDLIPRLEEMLIAAGFGAEDLGAIAVGLGPGSYTGLRVGVTAAKTLSFVTGARLIGLESLQAIGRNAPRSAPRVSVIADAQRGELYVAELARSTPGGLLAPTAETRIETLPSWLHRLETGTIVLGPALASARIRAAVPSEFLPSDEGTNAPAGESLVAMAREALATGGFENPWLLEPRYLRRSAAEDLWESRVRPARD